MLTIKFEVRDAILQSAGLDREYVPYYENTFDLEAETAQEAVTEARQIQEMHDANACDAAEFLEASRENITEYAPCYEACLVANVYDAGDYLFSVPFDDADEFDDLLAARLHSYSNEEN